MYLFTTSRHAFLEKNCRGSLGDLQVRVSHRPSNPPAHAEVDGELRCPVKLSATKLMLADGQREWDAVTPQQDDCVGMLQRDGQVMTKVVPNVARNFATDY